MAEYFVNNLIGSDAGAGTEEDPWFTVPGMTGANTVLAGDIINVRNGTMVASGSGRLILPANDLTYRGYGLADNVLVLTLPSWRNPSKLVQRRVVRQPGVHEGMWTIDGAGEVNQGILNYSTRTGCVVEDLRIINATSTSTAASIGTSTQAQIGATLRRCMIDGAVVGVTAYRPNTLIEDCAIQNTSDDGIAIGTGATQSLHAGGFVTLRRIALLNNGFNTAAAIGDPIQLFNSTGFAGTLRIQQCFIQRNVQVKQGIMLGNISGLAEVDRVHFDGQDIGSVQVGCAELAAGGRLRVTRNYWRGGTPNGNPLVRMVEGEGTSTGSVGEGAEVLVENNAADFQTYGGLFSWGSANTGTLAGAAVVRGNTCRGIAGNGLSWSAAIGVQTAGTITATASLTAENNALVGASPVAFRLPSAGAGDARWQIRGNRVDGALATAYVGAEGFGTSYATVSAFQAAHNAATANSEGDSLIGDGLVPLPGSPLLTQGADLGYRRDIRGLQSRRHIGAFGAARLLRQ